MSWQITKSFTFDAAHWLPRVPADHKCRHLHGHTYQVVLTLAGELAPDFDWVMDYAEIKAAFAPLLEKLDHACLNEIEGLENPTAEVVARWIFAELKTALPLLAEVTVQETPHTAATYRP